MSTYTNKHFPIEGWMFPCRICYHIIFSEKTRPICKKCSQVSKVSSNNINSAKPINIPSNVTNISTDMSHIPHAPIKNKSQNTKFVSKIRNIKATFG